MNYLFKRLITSLLDELHLVLRYEHGLKKIEKPINLFGNFQRKLSCKVFLTVWCKK